MASPNQPPAGSSPGANGLDSNLAAALSYLWIPAIIFLAIDPYKNDRFVRFHSFQSLIVGAIWFVLSIVLSMIPFLGWLILLFLPLVSLVVFILCVIKAYQKEWFKLPLVGDWAEKQAGPAN